MPKWMWQFVTRFSIMNCYLGEVKEWTMNKHFYSENQPDVRGTLSISLLRPKHLNVQRKIWQTTPRL